MSVSIVLADDQPLLRRGFRMILEAEPDLTVVGEAGNGEEAVDLARRHRPDVALMDIRMPGTDGIEATQRMTAAGPLPKVLVLTTFDLDEYVFAALRAGASGFLLKDVRPGELVAAIRTVAAGDAVVSPRVTRRLLEEYAQVLPLAPGQRQQKYPQLAALTEREREVLIAVARGMSNAEIAACLFVSEATVKSHVGRILSKLALRDRVQVVVLAYEEGGHQPAGRVSSSAHTALPVSVSRTPQLLASASTRMNPKPESSCLPGMRGCGQCRSVSWTSIRSQVRPACRFTVTTSMPRACRTALVTSSDTSRLAASSTWASCHAVSTARVACRDSRTEWLTAGSVMYSCRELSAPLGHA